MSPTRKKNQTIYTNEKKLIMIFPQYSLIIIKHSGNYQPPLESNIPITLHTFKEHFKYKLLMIL